MADIEKLIGSESRLEVGQKINEIIEYKANKNLNNTGMLTNCLLEVPQRINYTLENGTLTVKAGSVVIVPYGTEDKTAEYPVGATFIHENFKVVDTQFEDGKFFVWAELVNDVISNTSGSSTEEKQYMFMDLTLNNTGWQKNIESGTSTTCSQTYTVHYKTDTNLIGMSSNTTTPVYSTSVRSFVYLIATNSTSNSWKSVNQVFNGMGYIGSTIWVDKGVKGLIPNGRNEDGTLNNIEFVTSELKLRTFTNTGSCVLLADGVNALGFANNSYYEYDETLNYVYNTYYDRIPSGQMALLNFSANAGVITSFQPKQPFRAVDYNDIADLKAYIVETYVSGTSGYRVWSDGYCEQWGAYKGSNSVATTTIKFLVSFANTNYGLQFGNKRNSGWNYNSQWTSKTTSSFEFYTAVSQVDWKAYGYIA